MSTTNPLFKAERTGGSRNGVVATAENATELARKLQNVKLYEGELLTMWKNNGSGVYQAGQAYDVFELPNVTAETINHGFSF